MAAPAELSGSAQEPVAGEPPRVAAAVPQQAQAPDADAVAPAVQAPDGPAADGPGGEDTAADVTEPEPGLEAAEAAGAGYAGERRRSSSLAVVALIFGVLVLAVAAVVGLTVATHGFRPKTVVTYRPAAVFRLQAGDCINSSQNGLAVTVLSCATPHQAEVFATFSLAGTSWPGSAAAQQEAGNGCTSRIGGYLNPQLLTAGLTQQYVFPDQKAWQAGVHTVICEVSSSTGPLTGSVRQAG
ncbi:MAG: septum formation family protein [Streptosporangiaceae bacterium]